MAEKICPPHNGQEVCIAEEKKARERKSFMKYPWIFLSSRCLRAPPSFLNPIQLTFFGQNMEMLMLCRHAAVTWCFVGTHQFHRNTCCLSECKPCSVLYQTRSGKAIIVGGCPSRALGSRKIVNVMNKIIFQWSPSESTTYEYCCVRINLHIN